MEFYHIAALDAKDDKQNIVIPFWKGKKVAEEAASVAASLKDYYASPVLLGDFKASEGETLFLYSTKSRKKRIILLGLGEKEKVTIEKLRRAYSSLIRTLQRKHIKDIILLLPEASGLLEEAIVRGVFEGSLLANYLFDKLKSPNAKKDFPQLVERMGVVGASKPTLNAAQKYITIAKSVYYARDLVNNNADTVTPQFLAEEAKRIAKQYPKIKTKVLDKRQIEKEKMGLLLAVNRGSFREPVLITMEYRGNSKSKEHTLIVGKGITYDTGGLILKPKGSMETMKCDMAGAAAAIGTIQATAALGLKVNLTVVVPSTENSIDAASYKPGDVYTAYTGKTIEINDTDAEGRLVLADALAYGIKTFKPSQVIDFATLTGAIDVALGSEATGLFSNHDALANSLTRAGSETFERVWRMPLYEEYKSMLKSDNADMRNSGGRSGGSITAALFLQEFVDKTPWAHCDIASTAYLPDYKFYQPKCATGVGIRLMIEFLEALS